MTIIMINMYDLSDLSTLVTCHSCQTYLTSLVTCHSCCLSDLSTLGPLCDRGLALAIPPTWVHPWQGESSRFSKQSQFSSSSSSFSSSSSSSTCQFLPTESMPGRVSHSVIILKIYRNCHHHHHHRRHQLVSCHLSQVDHAIIFKTVIFCRL